MTTKKITPAVEAEVMETTKEIIPQSEEKAIAEKPEMDVDGFLAKRQEFIEKVNAIMKEGKDYHVIQNKKSLAKGGAEKIASIFGWTAEFKKDTETAESFNEIKGLITFICNLSKSGNLVGQGRGAATLAKNGSDPNKTIKMAQKSAFVDAVIRASGMSDFFTQDLEDMNQADIGRPQQTFTPRPYQRPVQQTQEVKVIERLSSSAELAIADLEGCKDKDECVKVLHDIEAANLNGKFTPFDWTQIVKIAKPIAEKFNKK